MKPLFFFLLGLISTHLMAQEEISLETCYSLVKTHHPLAKQNDLHLQKNAIDADVIKKSKLPNIALNGQASYQSDVTHVPIDNPMLSITPPNKDQYKASLTANQLIYGGAINTLLEMQNIEFKTQQKQVEISMYQLKKQVSQLYFSILLMQEKSKLLEANKNLLLDKQKDLKTGIKYGVVLASSEAILSVELLKTGQLQTEVTQNKKHLIATLSSLIGKELTNENTFPTPVIQPAIATGLQRPELNLFALQKQSIAAKSQWIKKQKNPKLFGFATGGYGNPGLNMLDNAFQTYYMVGVKLSWNIFDWNKTQKQAQSLAINQEIIDNKREVFELNTHMELDQQMAEIEKLNEFIESDKTIVMLRKKIAESASAELQNGTSTPSAYTTELTQLFESETNLKTHQIQLLLAKANYKITKGN
ncbi:MAG: outer membrane protein TolC [Flavobacteriales bacterium]|jgi:outer membrane protein TolC